MTPCSLKIETIISELVEGFLPIIPKISWSNFNQCYCHFEMERFYESEINTFNPYCLGGVLDVMLAYLFDYGDKASKLITNEKGF